ncbi:MAG TPA: TlpA disulfide reductase family protein [Thermoanaerobaculia bacterium]|jgi:thiol-disulfide isomerase/thioredoxin
MIRTLAILVALAGFVLPLNAQALVGVVRMKISAGDLATGQAAAEDHKRVKGADAEYLSAIAWIARGAEMLGRLELADETLRELREAIPAENTEHLSAYGAAIEVEGRLIHRREGRGAALRYFEQQLTTAQAPSLRSRIRKNINMLSLEGQPAPALGGTTLTGGAAPTLASLRGKPVVLFFFAEWCGDCKAQAPSLERVWQKYRDRVPMLAVTRLYSTPTDEKPMTPAEETAKVQAVWKESYAALADVPVVIDSDTMVRYGASATPSFALVDRRGVVRHYTATRLSEAELSRRIEELLAEGE